MRILLTGATGFVGSHLVEALAKEDLLLRALVRPTSETGRLRDSGVELIPGRVTDRASLDQAVREADVVVHLAALTRARDEAQFRATNETGTALLLEAAASTGTCRRFIYVSSLAAVGPSRNGSPVTALTAPRPLTAYGRSKLGGERACLAATGLQVAILRPPGVYGPRDRDFLTFFQLAARGILPVPTGPPRTLQLIHVGDLAKAIKLAALEEGPARQPGTTGIYHVAEERAYTWREVLLLMANAVGRKGRIIPVPAVILRVAGTLNGTIGTMRGRPQIFDLDKVRELLAPGWQCETDGAARDFGFSAVVSLERGLMETASWYREKGWLP